MATDNNCVIPPTQYETHVWRIPEDSYVSRSQRSRGNGEYQSAIPIQLTNLTCTLPSDLLADLESASNALQHFDDYAFWQLGNNVTTLGPMSAVLLRTEATSSSQIEHLTVGAKNLALETINESTSENAAIVVGNVRAMEAALRLSGNISEHNILDMHAALLSAQPGWEQFAGQYRDKLVWVGTDGISPRGASHVGPQPELVKDAMDDLLRFIQRDDLPVLAQCAIAHAQFETIHPFVDGNGRTGRALIHAILRNKGLTQHIVPPVSAGLLRHTSQYFDTLTAFRAGNAAPLLRMFADVCLFSANSGITLIKQLTNVIEQSEQRLVGVRKDAAARAVLPILIAQPVINTAYLREHAGLSKAQAERAVSTLAQHGILEARNSAKRNRVWEHRGIIEVLDNYAASLRRR